MITTLNLKKQGLEMFVGPLQAQILRAIWSEQPVTIMDVTEIVSIKAYSTIATTMNRLVDKGLLLREREDGMWYYTTKFKSEDQFVKKCMQVVVNMLREGNYI